MKNFILFLLLSTLVSCEPTAQDNLHEINWVSLEEAQTLAAESPRQIFIDVYTPWCGPCKMMSAKTFKDPKIIHYINQNFYAVKFNAESSQPVNFKSKNFANPNYDTSRGNKSRNSQHELTRSFGIRAYPTLLLLDDKLEVVSKMPGYKTPEQLLADFQKMEKKLADK